MYHSDTVMRIHRFLVDIIYSSSLPPPPHIHTIQVPDTGLNLLKPDSNGERWKPCMWHLN